MSHKPNYKIGDLVVDLGGMWTYIILDVLDNGIRRFKMNFNKLMNKSK